ncbi:MAG: GTP cyclohydrolase, FolE2/MptA family [Candidatus Methanomethylicia archaeon]
MIPDIQNEKPKYEFSLVSVGLRGLRIPRNILRDNGNFEFSNPKVSIYISLPYNQRGIHVSRGYEAIEKVLEENSLSTWDLARKLAETTLRSNNYSNRVIVKLSGKVIEVGNMLNQVEEEDFTLTYMLRRSGEGIYILSVRAYGMTACPCAYEISKTLTNGNSIVTHTQRAIGIVNLKTKYIIPNGIHEVAELIRSSMSMRLHMKLKREEEARELLKVRENLKFVEDVAREILHKLTLIKDLGDDVIVMVKVISFESVHPYNVEAKHIATLGQLRKLSK